MKILPTKTARAAAEHAVNGDARRHASPFVAIARTDKKSDASENTCSIDRNGAVII